MAKPPKRLEDLKNPLPILYTPTGHIGESKPFVLDVDEEGFSIPMEPSQRPITAWDLENIRDMMTTPAYDIPPLGPGQWVMYADEATGALYTGLVQADGTIEWTPCRPPLD